MGNFRKHVQDPYKGKFIFLDTELEEQIQALDFYNILRDLFLQWAKQLGKIRFGEGKENQFLQRT